MKSQLDNFAELMTERAVYKRALERIVIETPVDRIREIAEKALKKHGGE